VIFIILVIVQVMLEKIFGRKKYFFNSKFLKFLFVGPPLIMIILMQFNVGILK